MCRPPVILSDRRHPLARLNLPFILAIKAYQLTLSPIMGRGCRFEPTCSTYGVAAYRHHNPLRATYLTVTRILRCNPLTKGGYDPVPPVGGHPAEPSDRARGAPTPSDNRETDAPHQPASSPTHPPTDTTS